MHEHDAHLQQDLQTIGDRRRVAFGKTLGTVAPLKEEPLALGGLGKVALERQDLERRDQRRQLAQLRKTTFQMFGIGIGRLLGSGAFAPLRGRPGGHRSSPVEEAALNARGGNRNRSPRRRTR